MYLLLTKSLDFPPSSYKSDPSPPSISKPITVRDFGAGPQQTNTINNMLVAPAAGPSIKFAQVGESEVSLREIKNLPRRRHKATVSNGNEAGNPDGNAFDFSPMQPTKMRKTMHEGDISSHPHATAM